MVESFEQVLDRCLDRVRGGENVTTILADFPDLASRLRPLLLTAARAGDAYSFEPSADAKRISKQRFVAAMAEARETRRVQNHWFGRLVPRPVTWAAITGIIVVVAAALVGLRAISSGSSGVVPIAPVPNANGNFAFLVSDEVNAISDFQNVTVTISKIGLQQASDGKWIEVAPEITQVDLTKVPGGVTQQIWQGDIPAGGFSQVFVYVDGVTGVLKASGQTVEIKLPSNKLHISKQFSITDNSTTRFTYDMTVFATGNGRNGKYILRPQVDQSSVSQEPRAAHDKGTGDNRNNPTERPSNLPTPTNRPTKKPR